MQFSKRIFILIIIFVLISGIVLRYPDTEHEKGTDSFGNAAASGALCEQAYDKRFINSFSFFGLYPYSNNMGGLVLLSGTSICTGLDVESSILLLSMLLGLYSGLGILLLASRLFNNKIYGIFSMALFSLSRNVIILTSWTYSFRGPFRCLYPIFLFLLFSAYFQRVPPFTNSRSRSGRKWYRTNWISVFFVSSLSYISRRNEYAVRKQMKFIILAILFLIMLATIHKSTYFTIFIITSFTISIIIFNIIRNNSYVLTYKSKQIIIIVLLVFLILLYLLPFTSGSLYHPYGHEEGIERGKEYINSDTFIAKLFNGGLLYTNTFGFFIIFAPIGFFSILLNHKNSISLIFLVSSFYIFSLFWTDVVYGMGYILPFLILISTHGLLVSISLLIRKKGLRVIGLFIPIIAIIVAQVFTFQFDVIKETENKSLKMSQEDLIESAYNTGLYLEYTQNNRIISSIEGVSKIVTYTHIDSRESVPPGLIEEDKIKMVDVIKLLTGEKQQLFQNEGETYSAPQYSILAKGHYYDFQVMKAVKYHFDDSGTYNVIVSSGEENIINYEGEIKESQFLVSVQNEMYKIFDNGAFVVRLLLYLDTYFLLV